MNIVYSDSKNPDYQWIVIEEEQQFKVALNISDKIILIGIIGSLDLCVNYINNNLI